MAGKLTDKFLNEHFFDACNVYINQNGGPIKKDPDAPLFTLADHGRGIFISSWNHDSKEPTREVLLEITQDEIQEQRKIQQAQRKLKEKGVVKLSAQEITRLTNIPEFSMNYDPDSDTLQIYVNNAWRTLAFI